MLIQLGENSRKTIFRRYSWDIRAERLLVDLPTN